MIVTRRFLARPTTLSLPSGFVFGATGFSSPKPFAEMCFGATPPFLTSQSFTEVARSRESCRLIALPPFGIRVAFHGHVAFRKERQDDCDLVQRFFSRGFQRGFVVIEKHVTREIHAHRLAGLLVLQLLFRLFEIKFLALELEALFFEVELLSLELRFLFLDVLVRCRLRGGE